MNNYYRPPTFSLFPPVVKNLLIANILFFIATLVVKSTFHYDLADVLGLHYFLSKNFHTYQLVTYMFMHGGWMHIGFNMFALWMFGYMVENYWGAKRFIVFYFLCGIGAGLTQEVVEFFYMHNIQTAIATFSAAPSMGDFDILIHHYFSFISFPPPQNTGDAVGILPKLYQFYADGFNVIGASGAIFGVLLAFGMLFPNMLVYVYFAIPVKAKYFVLFYGALELFLGVRGGPGDDVAHFAHLGGLLFGFLLIMYWKKKRAI